MSGEGKSPCKGTVDQTVNHRKRRVQNDILKLSKSGYQVFHTDHSNEINVILHGPRETPYEGGIWRLLVTIGDDYPYKSPSIGFMNKIYHPNVDYNSGSICLNVLNSSWSSTYGYQSVEFFHLQSKSTDLNNIFDVFLPQLLQYPNPGDPMNNDAAGIYLESMELFCKVVRECVKVNATAEMAGLSEPDPDSSLVTDNDDANHINNKNNNNQNGHEVAKAENQSNHNGDSLTAKSNHTVKTATNGGTNNQESVEEEDHSSMSECDPTSPCGSSCSIQSGDESLFNL